MITDLSTRLERLAKNVSFKTLFNNMAAKTRFTWTGFLHPEQLYMNEFLSHR